MAQSSDYPVQYSIDYSDQRNRLTTLFRIILSIPINILWQLLSIASGAIFLPVVLMLLFRAKYPRWWFDFSVGLGRWFARVDAYAWMLATDRYPPFRLSP